MQEMQIHKWLQAAATHVIHRNFGPHAHFTKCPNQATKCQFKIDAVYVNSKQWCWRIGDLVKDPESTRTFNKIHYPKLKL